MVVRNVRLARPCLVVVRGHPGGPLVLVDRRLPAARLRRLARMLLRADEAAQLLPAATD